MGVSEKQTESERSKEKEKAAIIIAYGINESVSQKSFVLYAAYN